MGAILAPPAATGISLQRIRRLTVAEYHALIRSGVLPEDNRTELLEGFLVTKMPKNVPRIQALRRTRLALDAVRPDGWLDGSQDPITLSDSEPEPDYAWVRGALTDYQSRKPGPADIGLVIEVADSSLADDRTHKGRIYARAGVSEFWIVNLPDRQIEVYTAPDPAAEPPTYRVRADYRPGDAVPVTLDGTTVGAVAVSDVLP